MHQLRRGVFETNSSSTHSICITNDNRNLTLPDRLTFRFGNFGWQEQCLSAPEEKASYLYTSLYLLYEGKERTRIINRIYDFLSQEGIQCAFAAPSYKTFGDCQWLDPGSVDHCGEGDHANFVSKTVSNKRRLLRYLFSDNSFVLTGNDNDASDVTIRVDYGHEEYYKGN